MTAAESSVARTLAMGSFFGEPGPLRRGELILFVRQAEVHRKTFHKVDLVNHVH